MSKSPEDLRERGLMFRAHVVENYPITKEIEKHELLYKSIIYKS